jgi:DNA polymerase V
MPLSEPVPIASTPLVLGLFSGSVQAGFPSPADDHSIKRIDLNQQLVMNPEASFLFRMRGCSMINVGIFEDDRIIVDRSIKPQHRHIVLAVVDNEYTVKRYFRQRGVQKLLPENPDFPVIEFKEGQEFSIWGVVTYNLRKLLNG